jgi:hypothetical protein
MVVGDMPRREDDRAGNPFVGQDGQLLRGTITEICARLGVDSRRVFYTSAIRCRTPDGRPPEEDELDACLSWLVEEIESVNPTCILAVGAVAQAQVDAAMAAMPEWGPEAGEQYTAINRTPHFDTMREAEDVLRLRRSEAAAMGDAMPSHWRKRLCRLHGKWIVLWERNRRGNVKAQRARRRERERAAKVQEHCASATEARR